MAGADYKCCDMCGRKAFYDANLNYKYTESGEERLDYLGDWKVLCTACAAVYRCVIQTKEPHTE